VNRLNFTLKVSVSDLAPAGAGHAVLPFGAVSGLWALFSLGTQIRHSVCPRADDGLERSLICVLADLSAQR
jgi:hypothetical protein